ncbi:energy transducer TonB [Pedobacter steynii]|uniref:TonB C-terminal domain-containing protein n=1 Tax=Pedobacter steynii TaxID=430522 RepID=A0A1D7QN03_9SPHI|nr:energy transducer TonB [Pedobacter steynii]AOM80037.1 hypothetical protein BFS30_24465 [Pedobacter steynii]
MKLQNSEKIKKVLMPAFVFAIAGIFLIQSPSPVTAQEKPTTPLKRSDEKEKIYVSIDHMPEPSVDLSKYLHEKFKDPENAKNDTTKGLVVVQFIVGKDGKVSDAKIKKSIRADIDAEVLRVVNTLPDWKPGIHEGHPVAVYYTLPFRYKSN